MGISDKDRKRLWARSGNRYAICRSPLVAASTDLDPEAVVGDEAHIAARSPGGPRYATCAPADVDTDANLLLLCRTDHKKIDDQPRYYTPERLHQIKNAHQNWVETQLSATPKPLRIEPENPGPPTLRLLSTGTDVWNVIAHSHRYYLTDLDERGASSEELERSRA